ncbi:hypothetical protein [Aureliella helgolandensis]|uniref:Uncharacterized protein n=1 Tax=Aureliella helgolandensis TaxID=2527968 RepID=A0A518G5R1_9BACT|nr:hypothetical protein [Aureliella helgolandensis]QDV23909.1 hypothetical protein Q31a_22190 [Aureliella helgolandensis]
MHAFNLSSLANTFVQHSHSLLGYRCVPASEAINSYWLAAKFRHEEWSGRLARHRTAIQQAGTSARIQRWREIYPILQEILLAEPLARCVAYVAALLEHRELNADFSALAKNTLASHQEARQRCLHLIVFGHGLSVENAVRLNRLRVRMESLTDDLLASLPPLSRLGEYCFASSATAYAQSQLQGLREHPVTVLTHAVSISAGLKHGLPGFVDSRSGCGRLNEQLSKAVLKMLPSTLFDSFGVPRSSIGSRLYLDSPESDGHRNDYESPLEQPLDMLQPVTLRQVRQPQQRRWHS